MEDKRSDLFANSGWAGGPGPIRLEQGKRYYTELLFKEGGGGDNGAAIKLVAES